MNISPKEGKLVLVMSLGNTSMELGSLIPESTSRFFNDDDPRNTYIFTTDAQGRLQFAIEDQDGKLGQPSPKLDPQK